MPRRRLLLALSVTGLLLALGGPSAAAWDPGDRRCGTFFGLGYVPYYHYYPRANVYVPCCGYHPSCGEACYPRRTRASHDHGWGWRNWLVW